MKHPARCGPSKSGKVTTRRLRRAPRAVPRSEAGFRHWFFGLLGSPSWVASAIELFSPEVDTHGSLTASPPRPSPPRQLLQPMLGVCGESDARTLQKLVVLCFIASASALRIGVTGAHGFLGNEVVWQATAQGHVVRAIVRERNRAGSAALPATCEQFEAPDLSDPAQARAAAAGMDAIIHTASVFKKCEDMEKELVQPNIALVKEMVHACKAADARLVLTSSMAAVRGAGQSPSAGPCYTASDWNTASQRDGPGFEPYQYSKMESERIGWALAREEGVDMVALCPPMIFGPPRAPDTSAVSVSMVRSWLQGSSPVRSLLVSDVRDVAQAHLNAAVFPVAAGRRYIVGNEARLNAADVADAIRQRVGASAVADMTSSDDEPGATIAIGEQEVEAEEVLWRELGIRCRKTEETMADMAERLLCVSS